LLGWRGCWAEQLGRAAGPAAGGPSGKKTMWAENEEGEEIIIFPFYFPNKFSQRHFQIIFEFI